MQRLSTLGADHVIHPELEGGLEIVRHTLLILGYPVSQIQPYIDAVRSDAYVGVLPGSKGYPVLDQLVSAVRGVEIAWRRIEAGSPIIGRSLAEVNFRSKVGASVIALIRAQKVIANPKSETRFQPDDLLGLIGAPEELTAAERLLNPTEEEGT